MLLRRSTLVLSESVSKDRTRILVYVGDDRTAQVRAAYDRYAEQYDLETGWYDRFMLDDGRRWACSQARGRVLEVAIGTGLNLLHYPPGIDLVGIDLSLGMLQQAQRACHGLDGSVVLVEADAERLPFKSESFETVVCTLGLSSIPDDRQAVSEMARVLRPGGQLVLLGHVTASSLPGRLAQRVLQRLASTRAPDTQARLVAPHVVDAGLVITYRRTSRGGVIERLIAQRPEDTDTTPAPSPS